MPVRTCSYWIIASPDLQLLDNCQSGPAAARIVLLTATLSDSAWPDLYLATAKIYTTAQAIMLNDSDIAGSGFCETDKMVGVFTKLRQYITNCSSFQTQHSYAKFIIYYTTRKYNLLTFFLYYRG